MEPKWKKFERLVAAINAAEQRGARVTWNDRINGRQFDVTIRFDGGLYSYLTVIECKDSVALVQVEKVDALVTKAKDAKANKAVMVSSSGFQSGCHDVAARHAVELLVLSEVCQDDITYSIEAFTPALNVYDVGFQDKQGSVVCSFEDRGGRLGYLMGHASLKAPGRPPFTPASAIDEWQLTQSQLPSAEASVVLPFPGGTILHVPLEDGIAVDSMTFRCNLLEMALTQDPYMDNILRQNLATAFEVRDAKGELRHSAGVGELPLGFDTTLEPGKFYLNPAMEFHYYCESVSPLGIEMVLVESYQHGELVQAAFRMSAESSRFYVEVQSKSDLARLEKMLRKLRGAG